MISRGGNPKCTERIYTDYTLFAFIQMQYFLTMRRHCQTKCVLATPDFLLALAFVVYVCMCVCICVHIGILNPLLMYAYRIYDDASSRLTTSCDRYAYTRHRNSCLNGTYKNRFYKNQKSEIEFSDSSDYREEWTKHI